MIKKYMLMAMITLVIRARKQPKRYYEEITMKKVTKLFYIYNCYKKLKDRRNRKMWVRPIFSEQRRLLQGASDNLIVEMLLYDKEKYFNYLRMSPTMFDELLTLVGPHIEKKRVVRNPINARIRLQVTLRWLASGDSMVSLSYAFRIAQCTISQIIPETCEQIWLVLKDQVLIKTTEENWSYVAQKFQTICQFPHCIGAIDGKHVVIQAPPRSGSCYYNYKGSHSINLLAISDALNRFLIVDIGAQGRQSDGGVFNNSGLPHLFQINALHIPGPSHINNSESEFPYVLLGDEAFPLSTYMMRPYPRSGNLNLSKKIFNYRLSRARRTVECAFGILVARWRLYRRPIIASTSTSVKAVQATIVLHNFIIDREIDLLPRERRYSIMQEEERDLLHTSSGLIDVNNRNASRSRKAMKIRDNFAHYFQHIDPLPWQLEKVLNNDF